jgi:hypothetical protein
MGGTKTPPVVVLLLPFARALGNGSREQDGLLSVPVPHHSFVRATSSRERGSPMSLPSPTTFEERATM